MFALLMFLILPGGGDKMDDLVVSVVPDVDLVHLLALQDPLPARPGQKFKESILKQSNSFLIEFLKRTQYIYGFKTFRRQWRLQGGGGKRAPPPLAFS